MRPINFNRKNDFDFIILHSLSFLNPAKKIAENYQIIELYLDNDKAGKKAVKDLINTFSNKFIDKSFLYKNHKDLNEFINELKK